MPEAERLAELAGAVADGQPIDWALAERMASTGEEREAVAAFREMAAVGDAFATATRTAGRGLRPRSVLEPGASWGSLRVVEHVGRGRYGDVYRAFDPALDRHVALKLIDSREADGLDTLVVEEGRLMARVRHPNVVTIHGAQRIDDVTGLWMEFVEGRTLEAELAVRGPFPADDLAVVGRQLCEALAAVHEAGLVHRDVKASNVIREAGGRIVLGDFGTGRELDADVAGLEGLVGTPAYLAPEIFARQPATPRSDVYSLGVLLFHLATGEYPHGVRSLRALRDAHTQSPPRSPQPLRPDLPAWLRAVIDRLIEPDPAKRFETAEGALRAIVPPARAARRRVAAVAAIAAMATIAIAAWQMGTAGSVPSPAGPGLVHPSPQMQANMAFRGPAFNGRLIACQDSKRPNAAICDLATGEVRVLRAWTSQDSFAPVGRSMLLSPDGMRVAYQWISGAGPNRLATVNVIGSDGRDDRELSRALSGPGLLLHRWVADGSALLVSEADADGRRASLLPVDGGPRRDVWRLGPGLSQLFDLSPDQAYVVSTRVDAAGSRNLAVIDRATGIETMIDTGRQGADYPLWTPDGRAVVFISAREGGSTVMRQPMIQGQPSGAAEVAWRLGRPEVRLITFGADGTLFAMSRPGVRNAYVANIDLSRSLVETPGLVDASDAEDTMGADWSHDAGRLAYLRGQAGRALSGLYGTLVIRTTGGGIVDEIRLPHSLPESGPQVRWSPDDRRVAVAYGDGTVRGMTIDVVDLVTRVRRPVVSGAPFAYPRWDATGDWLYYQENSTIARRSMTTGVPETVYRARGFGIQRNGGFDLGWADGALAILATRPGTAGCVIRIVESAGTTVDRHVFHDACRAIAWSRDGLKILVSTVPGEGKPALWSLDRVGGDPVRLPIEAPVFHDLSLSPDGTRLLFSAGNPQWSMVMLTGMFGAGR